MKDRIALVTGASSGIGAATAELLAREGAVVAAVARRDGHIVTVSSTAGRYIGTRHSGYTASKHAVNAFCETLRQEVAELGIRVTIVEPGATTTEVLDSIPDPSDRATMTQHITKQGNMSAEDVANAVLFALKQPLNVNVREIWMAPTAAVG